MDFDRLSMHLSTAGYAFTGVSVFIVGNLTFVNIVNIAIKHFSAIHFGTNAMGVVSIV